MLLSRRERKEGPRVRINKDSRRSGQRHARKLGHFLLRAPIWIASFIKNLLSELVCHLSGGLAHSRSRLGTRAGVHCILEPDLRLLHFACLKLAEALSRSQ